MLNANLYDVPQRVDISHLSLHNLLHNKAALEGPRLPNLLFNLRTIKDRKEVLAGTKSVYGMTVEFLFQPLQADQRGSLFNPYSEIRQSTSLCSIFACL